MPPLRWLLPDGLQVAMSTAADGDLREAAARIAWCAAAGVPPPLVLRQVHGAAAVDAVDVIPGPAPPAGDAVVATREAIAVFGADCPPLVLAAPDAHAAAHCGWRGCVAGVVVAAVAALRRRSRHPPATWTALIGPGVHPDDYEVDVAVLTARAWPAGSVAPGRPGRAWLDLPAAIAADCRGAGVGSIARCAVATSRDPRLRSHRRHGPGHPQLLAAWRAPEAACAG